MVRPGEALNLVTPVRLKFQRVRFVARNREICLRLRVIRFQRQRAFVVQDGVPEIVQLKIGVAKIVEDRRVPLAFLDEILVLFRRLFVVRRGVLLVCSRKRILAADGDRQEQAR